MILTKPTFWESCLEFTKYWITYTFHPFFEDPLFRTGTTNTIDGVLGILLVFANIVAALRIIDVLRKASQKRRSRGRSLPIVYSRTPVLLFLASSALAIAFITILRHEHRRLKLASYAIIQTERDGVNWVKGTAKWREYLPDTVDLKKAAYKYAYGSLPGVLVDRIPWIPVDWSRNASVWDYFRLLVDDGRRNWWARQWVMGWVCWSVFVGVECTNRNLGAFTAVCFIFLGYCVSLSGMQFVFYALLLLPAKLNKEDVWSPKAQAVMGIALSQAGILLSLPSLLNAISTASYNTQPWLNRLFNTLQLSLIGIPLIIPLIPKVTKAGKVANRFPSLKEARKSLSKAWFVVSVISGLLHVWTSYTAFIEANPDSWFIGRHSRWGGQLSWLIPWRNEYTPPAKDIGHAISALSLTLGDHPWINAVGWDVVFSVVGLCFWSVLSRSDVSDMIKCSVFPWLDDFVEAVEGGLEVADETVRAAIRSLSRSPARAAAAIRQGARRLGAAAGFATADAEPAEEDAHPTRRSKKKATRSPSKKRETSRPRSTSRKPRESSRKKKRDPSPASSHGSDLVTGAESSAAEGEAAAVTLGLYVLGGLGMASAAVFGADQVAGD